MQVTIPFVLQNMCMCAQSGPALWDSRDCRHKAPLSMGFSGQEHWSGVPCPPPGHLLYPGIEPGSLTSPAVAGVFLTTSATWKALHVF